MLPPPPFMVLWYRLPMPNVAVPADMGVLLLSCLPPMRMKTDPATRQTADDAAHKLAPPEMRGETAALVGAYIDFLLAVSLLDAVGYTNAVGYAEDKPLELDSEHQVIVAAARKEFGTLSESEKESAFKSALPLGRRDQARAMVDRGGLVNENILVRAVAHDHFNVAESNMAVASEMWEAVYAFNQDCPEAAAEDKRFELEQSVLESINAGDAP